MAGTEGEGIGTGAEERGEADRIGEAGGGEGFADDEADGAAAFGEHLRGQQEGAEGWMDEAGELKGGTVVAVEEDGYDGGAGFEGEAGGHGLPVGVLDAAEGRVEGGDLAGGEDDEGSTALEMAEGSADGGGIGVGRVAEGVDGDELGAKFGKFGEERVGDEENVGADGFEESAEDGAFDDTEGVVGDDDEGAVGGDVVDGAAVVGAEFEFGDDLFVDGAGGPGHGTAPEGAELVEFGEAFEKGVGDGNGNAGGERGRGARHGLGVTVRRGSCNGMNGRLRDVDRDGKTKHGGNV